ncbi:hypothetical protein OSB04_004283 [Centaurea solstitialis]|uniref:Peptidase S49 domain-containing protein n=1 Tax=Centaurea solstitialis TaxID=347529 RepID=A0AA38UD95_9ASTR|nr:hypothetical protein OSB04_004283 [Centaurea solstitialis]
MASSNSTTNEILQSDLLTTTENENENEKEEVKKCELNKSELLDNNGDDDKYPSGEFEFKKPGVFKRSVVKLRTLIAYPWQRVRTGSVFNIKLRGKGLTPECAPCSKLRIRFIVGLKRRAEQKLCAFKCDTAVEFLLQISDQVKGRFSSGLSLPQICENFIKAAYDPRISGVYLHIESLKCGWAKVEEIRRHILDYRKSGKFIVSYAPAWSEKEYYLGCVCDELYAPPSAYFSLYGLNCRAAFFRGVLEKVGVEPQVHRIGKYKSAADQLIRKNMSEENREVLTTLLDHVYGNWVDKVSQAKGKKKEEIEKFINEGVYEIEKLKEDGWITDVKYDDEVISMLKTRLGIAKKKKLPTVTYKFIFTDLSYFLSESKRYKAVIIRIDSPGGDVLASDLIWREISLLAESKPVIASMVDVAASGGYYMAMAAHTIISENLTLTGSIGVFRTQFNLEKLYEKIGYNKEIISKGRFAELTDANRPFRPDEEKLFAESTQHMYKQFREKAARARSMSVDKMEEIAQGRVWTGNDAASRGLVDAIGGFSRAVAIAKQKANIPQNKQVTLVELSRPSLSLTRILFGLGSSSLNQLVDGLTPSDEVQARMDGIMFQGSEGSSFADPVFTLLKDYLRSP